MDFAYQYDMHGRLYEHIFTFFTSIKLHIFFSERSKLQTNLEKLFKVLESITSLTLKYLIISYYPVK